MGPAANGEATRDVPVRGPVRPHPGKRRIDCGGRRRIAPKAVGPLREVVETPIADEPPLRVPKLLIQPRGNHQPPAGAVGSRRRRHESGTSGPADFGDRGARRTTHPAAGDAPIVGTSVRCSSSGGSTGAGRFSHWRRRSVTSSGAGSFPAPGRRGTPTRSAGLTLRRQREAFPRQRLQTWSRSSFNHSFVGGRCCRGLRGPRNVVIDGIKGNASAPDHARPGRRSARRL